MNNNLKKKEQEAEENWKGSFIEIAKIGKFTSEISIPSDGTEDFFTELNFETNNIHIIKGGNGQGKSTLLKNIANACFGNLFPELNKEGVRLIKGSNNVNIGKWLNGTFMNPYIVYTNNNKEGSIFQNKYNNDLCNSKTNFVLYTDFSIDYYKPQSSHDNIDPHRLMESMDNQSNGERKIPGINDTLYFIKLISELKDEDIENGFDIMVLMDEPESGLSDNIQIEFKERIQHYIEKISNKISLTFFIVSHSHVWNNFDKDIKVHNIIDFKIDNKQKEEYKKVFL